MNKKAMIGLGILTGATMVSIIASAIKNNKIFKTNMNYLEDREAEIELIRKEQREKELELEGKETELLEKEAELAVKQLELEAK